MDSWTADRELSLRKRSLPLGVRLVTRLRGRESSFESYRISVLVMTFIAYTCYHASRKPLSVVKSVLDPEDFNSATNQSLSTLHTWPANYILTIPPLQIQNSSENTIRTRTLLPITLRSVTPGDRSQGWAPFNQHLGKGLLGSVDLAFLGAYSLGMYYAGHLGDRVDLRLFLTLGMLSSGFFVTLFGMAYWWNVHSLAYFIVVQVLAGLTQSTGWPSVVCVMGKWFGKSRRGLIMGLWNAHTSVGNILGSLIAAAALKFGWGWSFVLPGLLQVLGGLLIYLFLVVEPSEVGVLSPTDRRREESRGAADVSQERQQEDVEVGLIDQDPETISDLKKHEAGGSQKLRVAALNSEITKSHTGASDAEPLLTSADHIAGADSAIGFWEAWKVPGVAPFAFCLFFTKLVAYTFLNWLPFYIKQTKIAGHYLDDRTAGNLSTLFDVGGVVGGVVAGHLSDKLNARAIIAAVFIYCAIPALYMYRIYGGLSMAVNIVLMMIVGMLVNGPYALITTAVSADLGTHSSLQGNSRALATVTAIIDGTGSVGAAVGPVLTGYVSELGWGIVFRLLMLAALTAGLLLTRLVISELNAKSNKFPPLLSNSALCQEDVGEQTSPSPG